MRSGGIIELPNVERWEEHKASIRYAFVEEIFPESIGFSIEFLA